MIENFTQLRGLLPAGKKYTVSVAAAEDAEVIRTVKEMYERGIAEAILTGRKAVIQELCVKAGMKELPQIVSAEDEADAARLACELVRSGRAQILMKGQINSSVFLKAVLNPETGLVGSVGSGSASNGAGAGGNGSDTGGNDTGRRLLCHLAAFEVPGYPKLQFHSDGGMNLFPDLEDKQKILTTAVEALHRMGIHCPKVAVLSANEAVNPKVQSSVDAAKLQERNRSGKIGGCIVEGPMAMDVALSRDAAEHKHIASEISGDVDLFLVPDIEAGNMVGKTLMYCARAKMAGVILGADSPVIMVSRADNAEAKLNSLALALACLPGANA